MKKICELCGKEFEAKTANRRICYDEHYKVCKYCNNTFLLDSKEKVKHQIERDYCYDKECINKQKKDKTKQTSYLRKMSGLKAGLEGLEPSNAGVRILCLANLAIAQCLLTKRII